MNSKSILFVITIFSYVSYISAGSTLELGSPASILADLTRENTSVSSSFTLISSSAEKIGVQVEDFYFENGQLSMSGKALASENSSFLLKGTKERIYGWVALKDRNVAYEYTTNDRGKVIVEQVPVSKVITVCNMQPPEGNCDFYPNNSGWVSGPEPHIGEYDGSNVNELESLPGAEKVFYLDITRIMNGENPITLNSKEEIWKTWQCVASTLSMYQLNVTTSRAVYDAASVLNSGIATFLNQEGRSNADMNSFGSTRTSRNYKNVQQGYGLGRIAAHEIGHQLGLSHDGGSPGGEYFNGIPSFKWTPLMGNIWPGGSWGNDALYHYSKGEYNTATQKQDDLQVMTKYLEFREDDITDPVTLKINGTTVSAEDNRGQIHFTTDTDEFTFSIGSNGGQASLKIDRTEYIGGGMLDVNAKILDPSGDVVAEENADAARYAEIDVNLDEGEYTLVIQGGAEGTPSNGFSNYSSLGFYAIEGSIDGSVTGIVKDFKPDKSIKTFSSFAGNKIILDIPENSGVVGITLYSITGSLVYKSNKRVPSIDLSEKAAGIYVLHIDLDDSELVKNIIKR